MLCLRLVLRSVVMHLVVRYGEVFVPACVDPEQTIIMCCVC